MYKLNFLLKLTFVGLISLLTVNNVIGQIEFEKGYFIDNDGIQTECLIKNMAWASNPKEYSYKIGAEGEVKRNTIKETSEFCIYNQVKYVRAEVEIDCSSLDVNRLSKQRTPEWSIETLNLQVVIEGGACLYLYKDGKMVKFFYSVNNTDIKQLVYKKYIKEDKVTTLINKRYQNQLWTDLRLEGVTMSSVTNISYKVTSLSNYFKKYNEQKGSKNIVYKNNLKGNGVNLNLKLQAGIYSSTFEISNSINHENLDFGSSLRVRLGCELEMILPFYNNKWSIFIDPTYSRFNSETNTKNFWGDPIKVEADLHAFKMSFGIRHYFYLNDNSKVYINLTIPYYSNYNSVIDYEEGEDLTNMNSSSYGFLGVGIGYIYKRFGAEVRRDPDRDMMSEYIYWDGEMPEYSFTISYRLLGNQNKKYSN
jgi:hypothetical protein